MHALKVSVVLENSTPSQWIVKTLELLHQQEHLLLDRIILQEAPIDQTEPGETNLALPYWLGRKLLYGYIDRSRFDTGVLEPTSLPAHLNKLAEQTSAPDNQAQNKLATDVLLHFGNQSSTLATPIEAKFGTWIVEQEKLIHHIEQSLLLQQQLLWVHIWKTTSPSTPATRIASHALPMQSFSICDLIQSGFGCLPVFITSRLNWSARGLDLEQLESDQAAGSIFTKQAVTQHYNAPKLSGIKYLARSIALLAAQTRQRISNKTHIEQWQLGFIANDSHANDCTVDDYIALTPPKNTAWADPHLIDADKQTHVFFETFDITENKGRIATAIITPTGFANAPVTVLDEPHHLSYPFMLAHQNAYYMIPETAANRTISLYKASQFPAQWEHVRDLMSNVNYADSTLFFHNGLWWMFTNGLTHEAVDERDTLLLFYCNDFLTDDWQAHPLNPVVTGVDRARMAGNLYEKDGALCRPSQYGATRYGFGFNLFKINTLNTEHYEETLISRTTPTDQDNWLGCHTASRGNELTLVDRLTRVPK